MFTLRRPAVYVPLLLAIAGLVAGVAAVVSRGGSGGSVLAAGASNCPPIARDDAAFTAPGQPVTVDVLANDTDADGDRLRFDVISVSSGSADVDYAAARPVLVYTPTRIAGTNATIRYRVTDPSGDLSTATVTVAITNAGALPPGLRSLSPTEPNGDIVDPRCAKAKQASAPTTTATTTSAVSAAPTNAVAGAPAPTTPTAAPLRGRTTATTGAAVVVVGDDSGGGGGSGGDGGTAPNPQPHSTTTQAPSNGSPPPCTDAQSCQDYYNSHHGTTTTAAPSDGGDGG